MERFAEQVMKAFDELLLDDRKNIIKQLEKMRRPEEYTTYATEEARDDGYNEAIDNAIKYIESLNKKG